MKPTISLTLICLVLFTGCQFPFTHAKSYYETFHDTNLIYNWDFNESLKNGGGHTFNSSYFQLKKYDFSEIVGCNFQQILHAPCWLIPYDFQYKHEEGHIYHNQLLDVDDIDKFELNKSLQSTNDRDYFRQEYFIPVSEGVADYYAIKYFKDEMSNDYLEHIQKEAHRNKLSKEMQHYKGLLYVLFSLQNGSYANLDELILNLGNPEQYVSYNNYFANLEKYPAISIANFTAFASTK